MIEFDAPLSLQGEARRDQILARTKSAARARRNQRRLVRTVVASLTIIVCVAQILQMMHPARVDREHATQSTPEPSPLAVIERIETDPTITDRLSIHPSPRWQRIDDDELIRSLATTGQPAGLVQTNGQTILITSEQ